MRLVRFFAEEAPSSVRRAAKVLTIALRSLAPLPFASRIAAAVRPDATLRELVVPFGRSGYVLLFRVTDARTVSVLAARHQREQDNH